MPGRLEGKVAVITGTGGPGMGRAAALRFAREGALIAGCDMNVEGAKETARLVTEAGGTMISLQPSDLTNEADAEALMAAAESEFGGIDILYNNASLIRPGHSLKISADDLTYGLNGTIVMTWLVTKAAVPYLRKRGGGSVINISSSTAHSAGTGVLDNFNLFFAYGVGKAGVIRMTELMAIDLAADNIRVNCISPGSILPNSGLMVGEEGSPLRQAWEKAYLVCRPGEPDDVVNTALFFASDESAYITGQDIVVDGGMCTAAFQGSPLQRGLYDPAMVEAASGGQDDTLTYATE